MVSAASLTPEHFRQVLKNAFNAEHIEVSDTSGGCGQAFEIVVVSDAFKGKNRLARARAVNSALSAEIAAIHAFTQKAYTPEEYAKLTATE